MTIEECMISYLKDNYKEVAWSNTTGTPTLDGVELLNSELKELKVKLVAYITLNSDKKVKPSDLTKPLLKRIINSLDGGSTQEESPEDIEEPPRSKFDREKFISDKPVWYAKLIYGKEGIKSAQTNVEIYLEESDEFKNKLYYDSFADRIMYNGSPYDESIHYPGISQAVEVNLGFNNKYMIDTAIKGVALRHMVNPVIKVVESIRWEGNHQLEKYFVNIVGAPDTPLTHRLTLNFFYAMMNRLYNPGAPFSGMPILLDTTQGTGKTEIFNYLLKPLEEKVGYDLVANIDESDINNKKDLIHKIKSKWVMVFDECNALLKGDDAWLKSFITCRQDDIRLSYAKDSREFPRKCVFIANSNDNNLLKDYTGNVDDIQRRYMIIECQGRKRTPAEWEKDHSEKYKLQILAEALKFYKDNPEFDYLHIPNNMEEEMIEIQSRHKTLNENDVVIMDINSILKAKIYSSNVVTKDPRDVKQFMDRVKDYMMSSNMAETGKAITRIDVTVLKGMAQRFCHYNQSSQKLTHMMKSIGWEKRDTTVNKMAAKYFIDIEDENNNMKQLDINL